MSERTIEDLKGMDPMDIVSLVLRACQAHATVSLNEAIDKLAADPLLPLGVTEGVSASPVPVPLGYIEGREDLGVLGIRATLTLTLVNMEDDRAKRKEAAAAAG